MRYEAATGGAARPKNGMRPIHPGEILSEEFLKPLNLSANELARALRVPPNRVTLIVAGKRAVTADTALRLARALGTTADLWMNLQKSYDLRVAELDKKLARERGAVKPVKAADAA
jgi:addiction module HigA family antidote